MIGKVVADLNTFLERSQEQLLSKTPSSALDLSGQVTSSAAVDKMTLDEKLKLLRRKEFEQSTLKRKKKREEVAAKAQNSIHAGNYSLVSNRRHGREISLALGLCYGRKPDINSLVLRPNISYCLPHCTPWVIIRTGVVVFARTTLVFSSSPGFSLFPSLVYYPALGFHFCPPLAKIFQFFQPCL